MFQTHHPRALFHAHARAASGGPVYVTDKVGQTQFDILWPFVADDGQLLRTDEPARPTADSLFQVQSPKLFKIWSRVGQTGVVAAFNAADTATVKGVVRVTDVPGLERDVTKHGSARFAVFTHGRQTPDVKILKASDALPVRLKKLDSRLMSIVPISQGGVAVLGVLNKYVPAATVIEHRLQAAADTPAPADGTDPTQTSHPHPNVKPIKQRLHVALNSSGTFGAILPRLPTHVAVDGHQVTARINRSDAGLVTFDIPKKSGGEVYHVFMAF